MLAIHHRKGSFSGKWIEYCQKNNIAYKIVNCFDTDIIEQLKDCDGLMWHWPHHDYHAQLFARQLTYSLEKMGIRVFPDSNTCWHYDDKVGQKYLLESIDAPLVPSYVFYDKQEALNWAKSTEFPKVFKTRKGAGSQNVKLINNFREARKVIGKAFGSGVPSYNKYSRFMESLWKFKRDKTLKSIGRIAKYLLKLPLPARFQPHHSIEKEYVYFQDFIPDCKCDYRMKVIGNRCWGLRRFTREGDFRASGSGLMDFSQEKLHQKLIELSFEINKKLNMQSVAFDFVERNNKYLLVEISYASSMAKGQAEEGYWDSDLNWYEGKFTPEYFMIDDFNRELNKFSKY